jgi:chemotaxis protein histidine kinase CheA
MSKDAKPEANIFFVDTRFQKMARRPGGVARDQALADAQVQIEELKPDFSDWINQELQELNAALAEVEANSNNKSSLDRAFRNCSQLRDVGATMGFELVSFVANNLCEILDAIAAGAVYEKDMIDCHIDALLLARTDAYRHLSPEQVPEMVSGLRRVVEIASIPPAPNNE